MQQYKLTTHFHLNSYTARQVGLTLPEWPNLDSDGYVITGTYRQLIALAAQQRREWIDGNGYNVITVTRSKGLVTYTVRAHFGMEAYILTRIEII